MKSLRVVTMILVAVLTNVSLGAGEMQVANPAGRDMLIGADYYPEHWPKERWETDVRLMKEAGFNVVRLAEFAWVNMEPKEGEFDFGWLDEVLALLDRYDMKVILSTPTAVMPAWAVGKYPETMTMLRDGTRVFWGGRKNNCLSSGAYRMLSERITRAMAENFAGVTHVIGWQTDNEFRGTNCYCGICHREFQQWLRGKYGSLDELNRAWGTHFWGLTVQRWDEITIPDSRVGRWAISNPSASLDWKRFISWLNIRFQADQVKIIRDLCPDDFVTHNFMGLYEELDYYGLAEDLDFVTFDNYPMNPYSFGPPGPPYIFAGPEIPYNASLAADVMRGLKQKNFMIMEQTAGPRGWGAFARNPRPGEIRKIAYQQLAHGSDGQIWFRWRTCTVGREQYWHGLLGHDGKPLRRYREAAQTAKEFRTLEGYLSETAIESDVAIVYDYDSIWALNFQPGYPDNSFVEAVSRYYNALFRAGINVDLVSPRADLSKYKLVLTPDLHVMPDALANKLNAYVQQGGVLLADCRTAVKDETNLCHERTLPGLLSEMLGIRIEEYGALGDDIQFNVGNEKGFDGSSTAIKYVDWLTPEGAETVANYPEQWHMQSFAAVTRNAYGRGVGWYVGTVIKEEAFYDRLISKLLQDADIEGLIKPPLGVEVSVREGNGKKILFLINHTKEEKSVIVPKGKLELLSGTKTQDSLQLGRFDVAVIEL